ncbi:MAG TPA: DUF488 domain-containing protein [Mycobacteriales bacterium]|jgi:uncharacterized protein (DUF488 family)|nr:DUF488 domain-containing protein [Mycobacteriales bacterium]
MPARPFSIYTIGHSTHPIGEFVAMLHAYRVEQLVDIRSIPKSRHNPQFQQSELEQSLPAAGVAYCYMKQLGGLRHSLKDSVNKGWRNTSFRGYADYMQSCDFKQAVQELIRYAANQPTAIMCAEAVPWRCHRSLVGDALLVRGIDVIDIFSATNSKPHALTKWARVDGEHVTYPPDGSESEA